MTIWSTASALCLGQKGWSSRASLQEEAVRFLYS